MIGLAVVLGGLVVWTFLALLAGVVIGRGIKRADQLDAQEATSASRRLDDAHPDRPWWDPTTDTTTSPR